MLTRAPELLRQVTSLSRGSQKGDIYSFAFILYEMIGKNGPWGNMGMSYGGKKNPHIIQKFK